MTLYKNVDIIDLESILQKGILSLNESGNDNWGEGKRANNSCDVVYMFSPIGKQNSFCKYGVALLEIDIPDETVTGNKLLETDVNIDNYIEYVTDRVSTDYIKAIYIPELFRDRVEKELSEDILSKITWCGMRANYYSKNGKENCPNEVLERFAKTAEIMQTCFNFFRGMNDDGTVIDLYDIEYVL